MGVQVKLTTRVFTLLTVHKEELYTLIVETFEKSEAFTVIVGLDVIVGALNVPETVKLDPIYADFATPSPPFNTVEADVDEVASVVLLTETIPDEFIVIPSKADDCKRKTPTEFRRVSELYVPSPFVVELFKKSEALPTSEINSNCETSDIFVTVDDTPAFIFPTAVILFSIYTPPATTKLEDVVEDESLVEFNVSVPVVASSDM